MALKEGTIVASRALLDIFITSLAGGKFPIDHHLLRYQEYLFADLEIFENLLQFCEHRMKTKLWCKDDAGQEEFVRVALTKVPRPELVKQIITGGFVSLLPQLERLAVETIALRQELIALLIDPEKLSNLQFEIFAQPTLPPTWATALEKGRPRKKVL